MAEVAIPRLLFADIKQFINMGTFKRRI
jgi:hypothetical protein